MSHKKPITQVKLSAAIKAFRKRGGIVCTLPTEKNAVRVSANTYSCYEPIFERV